METLAKIFNIPATQNRLYPKINSFNKAPVRRIAIAMNTNSAFSESYTENPFWYQQFDLRQIKTLRENQPMVEFDHPADNCRPYVTTMKSMNFQDDIPSNPFDNFKDHYVLVFDSTSMQHGSQNYQYPQIFGEPLRLELNFTFPLQHAPELIVLGERMSSVANGKFGVVGQKI